MCKYFILPWTAGTRTVLNQSILKQWRAQIHIQRVLPDLPWPWPIVSTVPWCFTACVTGTAQLGCLSPARFHNWLLCEDRATKDSCDSTALSSRTLLLKLRQFSLLSLVLHESATWHTNAQGLSKKVQPTGTQSILAGTCLFFVAVNVLVLEFHIKVGLKIHELL